MPRLCPKCGIENSGAYSYCYSCGADLRPNSGYLTSIAGGISILASIASLPLWLLGIVAILFLLPCPQTCPTFDLPAHDVLAGIMAVPAFLLGFAGGLLILDGRRPIVGYAGLMLLFLTGILSLATSLWMLGSAMIVLCVLGLACLFLAGNRNE